MKQVFMINERRNTRMYRKERWCNKILFPFWNNLITQSLAEKHNLRESLHVLPTKGLQLVIWLLSRTRRKWKLKTPVYKNSVPARNFCLRAKVAPTTHFWGPDISRKGQCTSIFLICKREETVGKLRKWKWQFIWSWHGASLFIHNRGNVR